MAIFVVLVFLSPPYPRKWLSGINHVDLFLEWSRSPTQSAFLSPDTPPPPPIPLPWLSEILVGPAFLIATELINLTLGCCNNLTC